MKNVKEVTCDHMTSFRSILKTNTNEMYNFIRGVSVSMESRYHFLKFSDINAVIIQEG
jgi:hypothetical protein